MAVSWTCGGFGLSDYMDFYICVVEICGVVEQVRKVISRVDVVAFARNDI